MKIINNQIGVLIAIGIVILALSAAQSPKPTPLSKSYHTAEELCLFSKNGNVTTDLPLGSDENYFKGSGSCQGCHGFDPNGIANVDQEGTDVNPTDQWRATMMANSAKDPFWRAKVSHEVSVNPNHQVELEDKCTSCHAPLGHYGARFDNGALHYSMTDLLSDSLGLDGVSCAGCHQQDDLNIGNLFSGIMNFSEDTIYGPYGYEGDTQLLSQPMSQFAGVEPVYGEHIEKSELCASCHTLITNTVDLNGNYTGGTFVEQSTYHEWLNSVYASDGEENKECQTCHFPRIDDEVVLSANYVFLNGRTPYGLHYMVGGNTFMLELMKNRIEELGISATEADFDEVIERTQQLLTEETLNLDLQEIGADNDTASYELTLTNLTGHKFPSGYPARRAFVEFLVVSENGDTLFHNGAIQEDYEVSGQNSTYEPHYLEISNEEDVQIYEMVMGDVNDNVTTVLERADHYIKDNRLTPLGFSSSHAVYDTTIIAGNALLDLNFNLDNGTEGTGADKIIYKAPMNGFEGNIEVKARVWYQSVPPKWNEEMFAFETPEIDSFREMYNQEGADPVLIAEQTAQTFVQSSQELESTGEILVYPSILNSGDLMRISSHQIYDQVQIFDLSGRLVQKTNLDLHRDSQVHINLSSGTYLVGLIIGGKLSATEKITVR